MPPPPSSRSMRYASPNDVCSRSARSDIASNVGKRGLGREKRVALSLSGQPCNPLMRVLHYRLKLRISVLPEIRELEIVLDRSFPISLRLVDLAQPLVRRGQMVDINVDTIEVTIREVPLVVHARRIGLRQLAIRGADLEQVAHYTRIVESRLLKARDSLGIVPLGHRDPPRGGESFRIAFLNVWRHLACVLGHHALRFLRSACERIRNRDRRIRTVARLGRLQWMFEERCREGSKRLALPNLKSELVLCELRLSIHVHRGTSTRLVKSYQGLHSLAGSLHAAPYSIEDRQLLPGVLLPILTRRRRLCQRMRVSFGGHVVVPPGVELKARPEHCWQVRCALRPHRKCASRCGGIPQIDLCIDGVDGTVRKLPRGHAMNCKALGGGELVRFGQVQREIVERHLVVGIDREHRAIRRYDLRRLVIDRIEVPRRRCLLFQFRKAVAMLISSK